MITSAENKQMKNLIQLNHKAKKRNEQGIFVAEGLKMFLEAPLERVEAIYVSDSFLWETENKKFLGDREYERVSESVFKAVSDTKTPQGIITLVRRKNYTIEDMFPKERKALILILDELQDPGNLGTMIRTGEGAGITGVIMNRTTVDPYNPKTIRSTMGSIYRVPHYVANDLEGDINRLKKMGIKIYAAHLKGEHFYDEEDYSGPAAFLIGNEGNGLKEENAELADVYVKIPMEGRVESLNAAVAASLLMYEVKRQRKNRS